MRGKTLGGSSSVNGMVYNRGSQADWDGLEQLGNPGWGWSSILPAYKAFEGNQLGASPTRGADGPLGISTAENRSAICDEMIATGAAIGMRRVDDLNESDDERIGYTMATIKNGQRVSSAHCVPPPGRAAPEPHRSRSTRWPRTSCSTATPWSACGCEPAAASRSTEHAK